MPATRVVLLVTASDACQQRMLADLEGVEDVTVHTVRDCREARSCLAARPEVSLVVTELSHRDGNWCDLLRFVVDCGIAAHVVVCSEHADEKLRSEVVWRGADDVLARPYDRAELLRIVQSAPHVT